MGDREALDLRFTFHVACISRCTIVAPRVLSSEVQRFYNTRSKPTGRHMSVARTRPPSRLRVLTDGETPAFFRSQALTRKTTCVAAWPATHGGGRIHARRPTVDGRGGSCSPGRG